MKANYGPTIAVYRFIADDPAKVVALDTDLAALGDRFLSDGTMNWEYLLVTAPAKLNHEPRRASGRRQHTTTTASSPWTTSSLAVAAA